MAFWTTKINSGEYVTYYLEDERKLLRLTKVMLGHKSWEQSGSRWYKVWCRVGSNDPVMMCALGASATEWSCNLDLEFDEDVTFSVEGFNYSSTREVTVTLVGYFVGKSCACRCSESDAPASD